VHFVEQNGFIVDALHRYTQMKLCLFVVGYYLLWCGTGGMVYSSLTYDNVQHFFPFVGYYDGKVCFTVLQQISGYV